MLSAALLALETEAASAPATVKKLGGEKESTSREPRHLKFSVDDKVEVLSSEEGFAEAWAHAVIVSHYKGGEVVEYSKFVSSETGRNLKEKVRAL